MYREGEGDTDGRRDAGSQVAREGNIRRFGPTNDRSFKT